MTSFERVLGSVGRAVEIVLADGARVRMGPAAAPVVRVRVGSRDTLARIVEAPTLLAIGEAYVAGELATDDLVEAARLAYAVDEASPDRPIVPAVPSPPAAEAIAFHYDLSNDFYALFLDRRMVYTGAYYASPNDDLESAQAAKLDLVCRKLGLRPGARLLDLGCGWGGLLLWASKRYGVEARGVTLSAAQVAWVRKASATSPVAARIHVDRSDWQDVVIGGEFDAIAALGFVEHAGVAGLQPLFERCARLLAPDGSVLIQSITQPAGATRSTGIEFLRRHVFPGGQLPSVSGLVTALERSGFRIVDVEALGAHYVRTTAQWLSRLQQHAAAARALVGESTYRAWEVYLAGARVGFETGTIDLHQIVARRTGPPGRPTTRACSLVAA